ncbi:hypothetical protein DSECCO2_640140 [anaerobic digester metagenome]
MEEKEVGLDQCIQIPVLQSTWHLIGNQMYPRWGLFLFESAPDSMQLKLQQKLE